MKGIQTIFGDVPQYNLMWHELVLLNADKKSALFVEMKLGNLIFLGDDNEESRCLS